MELPDPPSGKLPSGGDSERRRLSLVGVALGSALILALGLVAALDANEDRNRTSPGVDPGSAGSDKRDDFPEEIGRLHRLTTVQAFAFEAGMERLETEHLAVDAAIYGRSREPELVIQRFVGDTSILRLESLEDLLDESAMAFQRAGGTIERRDHVHEIVDGYEVACQRVRVPKTDFLDGGIAVMCAWRARTDGILLTFRYAQADRGVIEARRVADAID